MADPWITLAAIATATAGVRLGPMVTPLARRRPVKVARETATLDRLSGGRLTLGVGLGSDEFGSEYSMTGEEVDDRRRAGCSTSRSRSWRAHGRVSPCTTGASTTRSTACASCRARSNGPACRCGSPGVLRQAQAARRAARHQGFFPVNLEHPEQLAEIVAQLTVLREEAGEDAAEPYDVVAALPPGGDPAPYAAAGATWWVVDFPGDAVSVDQVRGVIRDEQDTTWPFMGRRRTPRGPCARGLSSESRAAIRRGATESMAAIAIAAWYRSSRACRDAPSPSQGSQPTLLRRSVP